MDLKKFRSLSLKDFENGAVIGEIAGVIKELERRRKDPHDMVNMYQDENNDLRGINKILKQKLSEVKARVMEEKEIEALIYSTLCELNIQKKFDGDSIVFNNISKAVAKALYKRVVKLDKLTIKKILKILEI